MPCSVCSLTPEAIFMGCAKLINHNNWELSMKWGLVAASPGVSLHHTWVFTDTTGGGWLTFQRGNGSKRVKQRGMVYHLKWQVIVRRILSLDPIWRNFTDEIFRHTAHLSVQKDWMFLASFLGNWTYLLLIKHGKCWETTELNGGFWESHL